MKAEEFDRMFDEGEDVTQYLDTDKAMSIEEFKEKLKQKTETIDIDLPVEIVQKIDSEANKIGVARQALIKVWIVERLKEELSKPL
ncbi:MAG: CopG family transcriptional regulator [Epsilonproteobacteria bacterium]|nr:CopG family transcriptional regulator [Campylobacterota bacterium]NPA56985.1 CopG family transcriptional regulator [Campylobacterota bacterium]